MKKTYQATGRRKSAISQVLLYSAAGNTSQITISSQLQSAKTLETFFPTSILSKKVLQPFFLTKTLGNFDLKIKVKGGGFAAQADASAHALAKALIKVSESYVHPLRAAKLLTRDARIKERKKYGLKKARKAPQFSKR